MKKSTAAFLILFPLFLASAYGQSKLKKTYGIKSMKELTTPYANGEALEPYISEHESYNADGEWVEKVDMLPDGNVKTTEKRLYEGDDIIEEVRDQPYDRNPQERSAEYEKQVHKFKKGDKLSTAYHNRAGELVSTTFYTYNSFGDVVEKRTVFGDRNETRIEIYSFDDRGFKIGKRTEVDGILVETKAYMYE